MNNRVKNTRKLPGLTIGEHNNKNDESKDPIEEVAEGREGDEDVDESRNDVEKDKLEL